MLDKPQYESWKSHMELYIQGKDHGRIIRNSVKNGPLIWPTVEQEDDTVRLKIMKNYPTKKSFKLIVISRLPTLFFKVFHQMFTLSSIITKLPKRYGQKLSLLMQGTSLSKQERECKLYDEFDKFSHVKGETLYEYYLRFAQLINDINIIQMTMQPVQVIKLCFHHVQDSRVTFQQVQGRQGHNVVISGSQGNASGLRGNTSGQAKVIKTWYDDDIHDLRSVETEFPAIVFNDELTSEEALSCEPMVSSLNNNKIDFRMSFDESDDEDYMPAISYFSDLNFLKDFEKEFPAIAYNDDLTSKLDFLTKSTSNKDNDDDEIDIIPSSKGKQGSNKLLETSHDRTSEMVRGDYRMFRSIGTHRDRVVTSPAWRRYLRCEAPAEEMQTAGFGLYCTKSSRQISENRDLSAYWKRVFF
ncbi:hypothetical protein Tco_1252381 [Tanacetum coccineum]